MPEYRLQTNVVNEQGLHMRPADALARQARQFDSQIQISKEGVSEKVDAKDVMEITLLAAARGDQVWVEAVGDDAEQAVTTLVELIDSGFNENIPQQ